jgi:hypothetical protein
MHGGMHDIDALNANIDVGDGMDQLLDIELMLAAQRARNKGGALSTTGFERTCPARHLHFLHLENGGAHVATTALPVTRRFRSGLIATSEHAVKRPPVPNTGAVRG